MNFAEQKLADTLIKARNDKDYDWQSYFNDDFYQALSAILGDGHAIDRYKLPSHPTFSRESMHSNNEHEGGEWIQSEDGKWTFNPSSWNLVNMPYDRLQKYFEEVEPDSALGEAPMSELEIRMLFPESLKVRN